MGRRATFWGCTRTVSTFFLGFGLGVVIHLFVNVTIEVIKSNKVDESGQLYHDGEESMAGTTDGEWTSTSQGSTRNIRRDKNTANIQGDESWERRGPRVLCYILTGPTTHHTALHVKNTWGQRCDRTLFFSTEENKNLETTVLDVPEGYGYLWAKSKAALKELHHHFPDFDWYLKADDDTFVVVENLRYFLKDLDPTEPVYYGVKFKHQVKQGYMSGGGGYVLSRQAVKRFATEALAITDQKKCPTDATRGAEDLLLGQCLEAVGVAAGDSLDENGKPRFFSHSPMSLFYSVPLVNKFHWYWRYIWHKHGVGPDCCSPHLISFHDVDGRMMWTLETLLYRIRIHRELQPPSRNTSTSTTINPSS